ncbi:hypothetical protein [Caecibacteroides pullorum]|uniref:Uncharacterized protein n=1 Tax=Caecibacteroides pullorum TaxID=2725562 RepID=A0AA41DA49_9BACT|nr:hypothetical protein [Caecibacteroides pullorum]MBM6856545.1 hypothetical protein [Caecibacteroides pullorum]MBV8057551.1 hypothetical protein [Caecibacteroides pullorum]
MEHKIGEIFEYNGEWYQCIIGHCNQCSFDEAGSCKFIGNPYCAYRNDKKLACFKKLEKVGEPFTCNIHGDERLVWMQEYKLYDVNFCKENALLMYVSDYKHKRIAIEIKQTKENMEEYRMHDAKEDIPEFDKVVDECLFGEDKLNLKPFDLEAAKAGKTVCTRDGRKARIICFDRDWDMHIVALVSDPLGESVHYYLSNGKVDFDKQNDEDLMMLPEKKEGWINVNKDAGLFKSKEEAERDCTKDYATVRVEFEI